MNRNQLAELAAELQDAWHWHYFDTAITGDGNFGKKFGIDAYSSEML